MTCFSRILSASAAIALLFAGASARADLLFWSTQARPVEEAKAMRDTVLNGFKGKVDYQPNEDGPWLTRLKAELQANSGSIGVLGALDGNFSAMKADDLVDLDDLGLSAKSATYNSLAHIGTAKMKYVPWMQATYIMAANKKALPYLPKGADINALTYDQLIEWTANIEKETGEKKFGFPAGEKGLKHRFFQGYLYPSFTNGVVRTFGSPDAVVAWEKFRELWSHTNPGSTNFSFMQEQLLSGDAWVVWDHTSRLAQAFNTHPDDFVAFPAPAGPKGRGFMPVLAGLAIPRTAANVDEAKALIKYMLSPATQIATLRATSFFPVIDTDLPADLPAAVQAEGKAVAAMTASADANPGMLPTGLGDKGGNFNRVFIDSFERIILGGQDIQSVLQEQKKVLSTIMTDSGAPCWAPDKPSQGPCPVE